MLFILVVLAILAGLSDADSKSSTQSVHLRTKRDANQFESCRALCGDFMAEGRAGSLNAHWGGSTAPAANWIDEDTKVPAEKDGPWLPGPSNKNKGGGGTGPDEGESQAEYNCKTWGHMCWGGHGKKK